MMPKKNDGRVNHNSAALPMHVPEVKNKSVSKTNVWDITMLGERESTPSTLCACAISVIPLLIVEVIH